MSMFFTIIKQMDFAFWITVLCQSRILKFAVRSYLSIFKILINNALGVFDFNYLTWNKFKNKFSLNYNFFFLFQTLYIYIYNSEYNFMIDFMITTTSYIYIYIYIYRYICMGLLTFEIRRKNNLMIIVY